MRPGSMSKTSGPEESASSVERRLMSLWGQALGHLLAGAVGLLAVSAAAQPAGQAFVFEVPDGRLKGGARVSIRLQEVGRSTDELVLRVIQRKGPPHARRTVVMRGVCTYMIQQSKKIAELVVNPRDPDIVRVLFPAQPSQEELDDERRMFFTENLCHKLLAGPP